MLASEIFKANDIRGIVGREWDVRGAKALGGAYAQLTDDEKIVIGHDMRVTGDDLAAAFIDGVTAQGVDVIDAGLSSTDELWFDSGFLNLPGVQITASHNPPDYNGMKFCRPGALPVAGQFLCDLASLATSVDRSQTVLAPAARRGSVERRCLLTDYASFLLRLVDLDGVRRLKVVVDAGNGMAGYTAPALFDRMNADMVGLFMDLDGTFPNHQPNPLEPANLVDARRAVVEQRADLAIVFDGDADRAFIIDERGDVVSPSTVAAMIAVEELREAPGATIVVNTITSSAVREIVEEHGGRVVQSRVGHTYMKSWMSSQQAVFGGEHSGHFYFRDFFGADSGMLAGLHVLALLGHADKPLSELAAPYVRYASSGEINSAVADPAGSMRRVADDFAGEADVSWYDGVKITGDSWWVSLRSSNTEPLLRLNVEAPTAAEVDVLTTRVLTLIKEET